MISTGVDMTGNCETMLEEPTGLVVVEGKPGRKERNKPVASVIGMLYIAVFFGAVFFSFFVPFCRH